MLLYYITDRSQFGGDESARRKKLLEKIAEATQCGIDFIQLREKDLSTRELESLTHDAIRVIRDNSAGIRHPATRVLINSRTDVAIACGADGVHLRSNDISPDNVRNVWQRSFPGASERAIVTVSCHSLSEMKIAADNNADFALFGPVFEKAKPKSELIEAIPSGLNLLRDVCCENIPLIALGGVAVENAKACVSAGATGVAGIRLFQNNQIADVVEALRSLV